METFEKLFSSGKIGKLEIKNRIVMPPMGTCLADVSGAVNQKLIDYYVERAKGGVGLIIVENTLVNSRHGIQIPNQLRIDDFNYVPQLYELVEAVHWNGAKIAIQINAAGSGMRPHLSPGITPLAPSSVKLDFQPHESKPLTIDEIKEIILDFGKGSKLAKMAGFDAVEIHGAHGYLINQFLSLYCNKRTDSYGGDFEGRLRFCLDVISEVRKEVGPDFPLLFRMSVDDFMDGGMTLDESIRIAKEIEKAGIDAFDVSAGNLNIKESCIRAIPPMFILDGHLASHAKKIKEVLRIPVIVAGKIRDPELAEKILQEGKADFIAIGRGLLSDPQWPQKAQNGRMEEIRRCISCNDMCIYRKTWLSHPIRCTVNPMVGREREKITKAEEPKKVVIIGGGPAGMEAARDCALKGHDVTLYEKGSTLGGQLLMACILPFKKEIKYYIDYLIAQLNKLQVEVHFNQSVTPNTLDSIEFDTIVIATGARSYLPDLPGIKNSNVFYYDDVLLGRRKVNGENIIVAGGGMIGCETAMYLAEKEKKRVTIIEKLTDIGGDIDPIFTKMGLMKRLTEDGITILMRYEVEEILKDSIRIHYDGKKELIKMDNLVVALGRTPNQDLRNRLQNKNYQVYSIGDCVEPRKLPDAIHEGFCTALKIQ